MSLMIEALEPRQFMSAGAPDTSFGTGGKVTLGMPGYHFYNERVAVQSDGKVVLAGNYDTMSPQGFTIQGGFLARFKATGSSALDTSFGSGGKVFLPGGSYINALGMARDGKIVVAGSASSSFLVMRYTTAGAPDSTFGAAGRANASFSGANAVHAESLAIASDGKIVCAGLAGNSYALARFTTAGKLDTTFSGDGKFTGKPHYATGSFLIDTIRTVRIQSDGKIVGAGAVATGVGQNQRALLVRLTTGGNLDTTFGGTGEVSPFGANPTDAHALAIASDGFIYTAGSYAHVGKISSAGKIVTTFGQSGVLSASDRFTAIYDIALQGDGKLIAAGTSLVSGQNRFGLARYNSSGAIDKTFGTNGLVTTAFSTSSSAMSLALRSDGRITVAGSTVNIAGGYPDTVAVARYLNDYPLNTITGKVFDDSDGDGVKDSTEAGLSSWKLFIDSNRNGLLDAGEKTALTDSAGNYRFSSLAAGTYVLRIVKPTGWTTTTPVSYTLSFTSGGTTTKNFGAKHS